MSKQRFRVGIRGPWYLPNAGIAVVYLDKENADRVASAITALKAGLKLSGYANIADRVVFEGGE